MNEEKEDPILAAPSLIKDESIPMDTNDNDTPSNTVDSSSDDKQKILLNYDQRRLSLLNNPEYGVILAFLDKFRSNIDIQDYPLHLLEENLLSDQDNISRRLIDFHLTLLKRISLGKGAQRDKFVPIITKFAYRFDYDDGEYLKANGYSQAQIDIKLRILKNLLETQFDLNQGFKTALLEKQSFEIRSQSFGRDRSGASYWLFMDSECFIRLFRENIDEDRTWTNIAKDKDELENIIKLLITDHAVRKKFPDWKLTHESFNSLESSNEFEERYIPLSVNIKKEELKTISPTLSPAASPVKVEKKSILKSKKSVIPAAAVKTEVPSDHESTHSDEKNGQRSRIVSSEDTNPNVISQEINNNQEDKELKSPPTKKSRGRKKSATWSKKKRRTISNTSKKNDDNNEQDIQTIKTPTKGRKRKQIIDDDIDIKKNDETSQDKDILNQIPIDDDLIFKDDLPIALRRSRRVRKPPTNEQIPSVTSSPAKSVSQTPSKKKLMNGKCKSSSQTNTKVCSQSSKSNSRRKRGRKRKSSVNGISSSSDDEHQPSEEEEDEYNSDDYLQTDKQLDELDDDDLLEKEDDDEEFVPRRSAKTVAKRRGQMNENNTEELQSPSSACCVCSKTDRPESLLLCDDCDDAYHLECLKPILLSVPDGDWYCPLCEHKRLSDNLVEKYIQLLKEYEELEVKRTQCMSKRTNRLANVMLNLDRMVKRSSKKRRANGIVYSDEENEEEDNEENNDEDENNKSEQNEDEEEEDDDSVYGFKDDGSIDGADKSKRSTTSRRDRQYDDEPQTLGVRSCRRKPQNYRFDDYDKKMKEAMIESGVNDDEIDKDSDEEKEEKKKAAKKRAGYENDEDFDNVDTKKDAEFAPDDIGSGGSDTEEEEEDYNEDDESSEDDWKGKQRRSLPKKKTNTKSYRRKSKNKSDDEEDDDDDDDDSLSDTELNNIQTANRTKSATTNDNDLNESGNEDRRRSSRATTQRNYAKQQDYDSNDDDEDLEDLYENGRPPPRRMRYKKRRGSDDSFVDDDDDYEKLQRKRKIVKYGKSMSRSSITDHLKNLVDEDEEPTEGKRSASSSQERTQEDTTDVPKQPNKVPNPEFNEQQPSDDDDFPDEQEIFKANGLLKFQKTLTAPKPTGFRPPPPFGAPTHSYQHAIVDPTARFAMIRPPVRPAINNGYPSNGHDPNLSENQQQPSEVNGHIEPSL
ncbi:unnamed protein product [Adineta steineri]|uniref:PHD-type domain-containing protein n=3 Tax=Adineta steineri TaxID=433720 RepID=A0A818GPX4_9BILA|nr:unnamed protein product [Adineta steineri]